MFCLKQIKEDKFLFVLFLFFHALLYFVLLYGGAIEILKNYDETTNLIFKSFYLFSMGYWFSSLFELIILILGSVSNSLANLTQRSKSFLAIKEFLKQLKR